MALDWKKNLEYNVGGWGGGLYALGDMFTAMAAGAANSRYGDTGLNAAGRAFAAGSAGLRAGVERSREMKDDREFRQWTIDRAAELPEGSKERQFLEAFGSGTTGKQFASMLPGLWGSQQADRSLALENYKLNLAAAEAGGGPEFSPLTAEQMSKNRGTLSARRLLAVRGTDVMAGLQTEQREQLLARAARPLVGIPDPSYDRDLAFITNNFLLDPNTGEYQGPAAGAYANWLPDPKNPGNFKLWSNEEIEAAAADGNDPRESVASFNPNGWQDMGSMNPKNLIAGSGGPGSSRRSRGVGSAAIGGGVMPMYVDTSFGMEGMYERPAWDPLDGPPPWDPDEAQTTLENFIHPYAYPLAADQTVSGRGGGGGGGAASAADAPDYVTDPPPEPEPEDFDTLYGLTTGPDWDEVSQTTSDIWDGISSGFMDFKETIRGGNQEERNRRLGERLDREREERIRQRNNPPSPKTTKTLAKGRVDRIRELRSQGLYGMGPTWSSLNPFTDTPSEEERYEQFLYEQIRADNRRTLKGFYD